MAEQKVEQEKAKDYIQPDYETADTTDDDSPPPLATDLDDDDSKKIDDGELKGN